jgi:hypothetical protein
MNEKQSDTSPAVKPSRLSPSAQAVLAEQHAGRPVWVRPPKVGQEFYSGLTRAKLYQLASEGKIKTASLREPGALKGTRLFHLQSVLNYVESCMEVPA